VRTFSLVRNIGNLLTVILTVVLRFSLLVNPSPLHGSASYEVASPVYWVEWLTHTFNVLGTTSHGFLSPLSTWM